MLRFLAETGITLGSRILSVIIGLGISIVIARSLGPTGRGEYALATLLAILIVTFANLGIGSATTYFIARKQFDQSHVLVSNLIFGLILGAGGALIGFVVVVGFGDILFPNVPQNYLFIGLLIIPFEITFIYLQAMVLGIQDFKLYNLSAILRRLTNLILLAIMLIALGFGVVAAIIAGILAAALIDIMLYRRIREPLAAIDRGLSISYLKAASKYGLVAHLGNVFAFLNYRFAYFLVNGFLSPASVGIYAVAVGLAERLMLLSRSASTVMFPKIAEDTAEEGQRRNTPLVARTVLVITLLASIPIYLLAPRVIVFLYSSEFAPSIRALRILLPGIVALSFGRVLANDIAGRGRVELNTFVGAASLGVNIILNILLIPRLGLAGAALASTVTYLLVTVTTLILFSRLTRISWRTAVVPRTTDIEAYRTAGASLFKLARESLDRIALSVRSVH